MPGGCDGGEILFPDNTTPIKFLVEMSQNEFTKLLSAVMTGADLSYPNESHEVVWILLRQVECPVSLCDEILACLEPSFTEINTNISNLTEIVNEVRAAQQANGAQAPGAVETNIAGEICGGAAFVVDAMNAEIVAAYNAAETSFADNLNELIPVVLEAIPVIGELPFDEMFELVNMFFQNQQDDYEDDFVVRRSDLIGSLRCFIEANDYAFTYEVWGDWLEFVGVEFPADSAAQVFSRFSPLRQNLTSDIAAEVANQPTLVEWFQELTAQYLAGTTVPIACPVYDCPQSEPIPANVDLPGTDSGFAVVMGTDYRITSQGLWNGGSGGDVDAQGQVGVTNPSAVAPAANLYSMLYRVGTSGSWTYVGLDLTFTASASGNLYFIMNDVSGAYGDNTGEITVTFREV